MFAIVGVVSIRTLDIVHTNEHTLQSIVKRLLFVEGVCTEENFIVFWDIGALEEMVTEYNVYTGLFQDSVIS